MTPLTIVIVASIIELIAALLVPTHKDAYALVVGIVSLIVAFLLVLLQSKADGTLHKKLFTLPKVGSQTTGSDVNVERLICFLLFAWWAVGTGILTFTYGPFVVTSNGYFATWLALAGSLTLLDAADVDKAKQSLSIESAPTTVLLIAALVVLAGALQATSRWEAILCIIIASIAIFFCLALLLAAEKIDEKTKGIMAIVMLVAWCAEAGIGTFRAPFGVSGNGFFASWVGLLAIVNLAQPALPAAMQAKGPIGLAAVTGKGGGLPAAGAPPPPPPGPPPNVFT